MPNELKLSVIVPCFNETGNVPRLKADLLPVLLDLAGHRPVELILVDDGSTDGTLMRLRDTFDDCRRISIKITGHPVRQGLGAALRTGFALAQGEIALTTDCDGTYSFQLIPQLLSRMTPQVDVVSASQLHPLGRVAGVPGYRRLLSLGCSAIYRSLVSKELYTYTSLFRAYRREVIKAIAFKSDGFLAGTELLVKAVLAGYHVIEYPATLTVRTIGTSKIRLGQTILAHLRFQGEILLHRLSIRRLVI